MSPPGRPLRVLAVAGLALPVWLLVRVPELQRRHAAIMAALRPAGIIGSKSLRRPGPAEAQTTSDPVVLVRSLLPTTARVGLPVVAPRVREAEPPPTAEPMVIRIATPGPAPIDRGPGPPAPAAGGASLPGFDLATRAYERLATGKRRDADRLFAAALAAGPDAPQAVQWAAERRRLNRRWSGDAFVLFRDAGPAASAAASPVLGGGQSGATLAYGLDPLARRQVAVFGRVYAAHDDRGLIDGTSTQAALGVRWQVLPGVSIAAERLIAVGGATSGDWNLRVAASGERRFGPAMIDAYGEAGARGNGDVYAGGQAHAMLPVGQFGPVRITAGPALWGSAQSGFRTVYRIDVGAGITAGLPRGITARAEYRWRAAGNAAPVNGPAVTIGWGF